jgi:hypothetical protein
MTVPITGPGKYDDLCTIVRERSNARAAIVIIVEGNKGGGFSVQGELEIINGLPDLLEHTARMMRAGKIQ